MPENFVVLVPTFWVSILTGISFIATPVKVRAPSLARPVAFDIGRVTSHVFSRIEWLLTALLVTAAAPARGPAWRWPLTALVVTIVLLQSIWLLPPLD